MAHCAQRGFRDAGYESRRELEGIITFEVTIGSPKVAYRTEWRLISD
jgi:hypothetical protein